MSGDLELSALPAYLAAQFLGEKYHNYFVGNDHYFRCWSSSSNPYLCLQRGVHLQDRPFRILRCCDRRPVLPPWSSGGHPGTGPPPAPPLVQVCDQVLASAVLQLVNACVREQVPAMVITMGIMMTRATSLEAWWWASPSPGSACPWVRWLGPP